MYDTNKWKFMSFLYACWERAFSVELKAKRRSNSTKTVQHIQQPHTHNGVLIIWLVETKEIFTVQKPKIRWKLRRHQVNRVKLVFMLEMVDWTKETVKCRHRLEKIQVKYEWMEHKKEQKPNYHHKFQIITINWMSVTRI